MVVVLLELVEEAIALPVSESLVALSAYNIDDWC